MRVLQFCNLVSLIKVNIITEISFIPEINSLAPEDAVLDYGLLGNFSLAGFEMVLTRYVSTYIITYYLPSGESQGQGTVKCFTNLYLLYNNIYQTRGELTLTFCLQIKWTSAFY